jgi:hypothetical protein
MWVFVLSVQDDIKVVRVSGECLYWLFRIVLRCYNHEQSIKILTWNSHHLNTIPNSQLQQSHETLTTSIQSWTVNKNQDCITVVRVSFECWYWLFRIVLRLWEFHVSVVIDCSGLYSGGESFMWVFLLTVQIHSHETLTTLILSWTVNTSTHMKLSPP